MTITFLPIDRDAVLSYLGTAWPARPGTTYERVRFLSEEGHGVLAVQSGSQPGISWYVVDGVVVPQDAGPPPGLEGDEMITLPPDEELPPPTSSFGADTPA